MHLNEYRHILVIISTGSKGQDHKIIKEKIEKKLSTAVDSNKFEIKLTEDEDFIKRESKKFSEEVDSPALLIIVGGDGSVNEVVNSIYPSKLDLAFLPAGTGNDLSKTVYPSMDLENIIDSMEEVEVKNIDLIKVNDLLAINTASFGYDSIVLEKSIEIKNKYPFLRKVSYMLGVIFTLHKIQKYAYKYKFVDEKGRLYSSQDEFILTAICNGRYYGGGFNPAPEAELDDGLLDLNTIDYMPLLKLIFALNKYKSKRHYELIESNNHRIVSASFEKLDGETILANVDGNIFKTNRLDFKIIENAINLAIFKKS